MTEESKITFCPNCQQPATRTGNEIACESCDAVFVIKQKEGIKVKQVGPIEDLRKRVERLESLVPGEEPEPKPEPNEQHTDSLL